MHALCALLENKAQPATLHGFIKHGTLRWSGGCGRSRRTHQVDWAADVAVHERHEAIHQIAGKDGKAGSGAACCLLQCPGVEHTHPISRMKTKTQWKTDSQNKILQISSAENAVLMDDDMMSGIRFQCVGDRQLNRMEAD